MASAITTEHALEVERNELGYNLVEIREGRKLRVVHFAMGESDVCVFFVHGGGGRAGQFKHLISRLKNVVNVVAFDFLGHGESPHIPQSNLYTADEHLRDLRAIFKMYRMNRNVYISHCYGTAHVLRHVHSMTRKDLESLAGVMMIADGVTAPASLGFFGRNLPAFVLEWCRPLARSASNAAIFAPESDPSLIHFENSISDTNRMYAMRTIGVDCSNQPTWYRWFEEGSVDILRNKIPCCLVVGEYDGIFTLGSTRKLKEMMEIPDEQYHVIKGVGHLPMLEKGEEVLAILRDFLCNYSGALVCIDKPLNSEDKEHLTFHVDSN